MENEVKEPVPKYQYISPDEYSDSQPAYFTGWYLLFNRFV